MNFFTTLVTWFKKIPSKAWLGVLAVLLLVGAFAAGRYTLPAKVITKTETVVQEKIVTQIQTQYVEKKVYVTAQKKDVQTVTDTVKKPDGTVETKVTVVDKTQTTATDTDQASSTSTDKTAENIKTDTVSSKVVVNQAQWHLRLDGGLGARFVGQTTPVLVLGAGVERRILGPLFLGIWAHTTLNLVAPSTPPYEVTGGLSIGFEL